MSGVEITHRFWPGESVTAVSDEAGRFEATISWKSAVETTWYALQARKFGFAFLSYSSPERLREGQELDVGDLTLAPGSAATGLVRLASGRSPVDTRVVAVADTGGERPTVHDLVEDGPEFPAIGVGGTVQDNGSFDLVGVPTGRHVIWVKHPSTYWAYGGSFEFQAAEREEVGVLVLQPLPAEWSIQGTVVDDAGAPVEGAIVQSTVRRLPKPGLRSPYTLAFSAETNAEGRYELFLPWRHDEPLELRVEAQDGSFTDERRPGIEPGAREVDFRVHRMVPVEILVLDRSGVPVEVFGWSVSTERNGMYELSGARTAAHAGGKAQVLLPPGHVSIEVRSPSHDEREVSVTIPVESMPIVFRLDHLDAVTGQVLYRGSPVANARVELAQREPNYFGEELLPDGWSGLHYSVGHDEWFTDDEGYFRIPNDFPHLKYYAHAWKEGFAEGFSGRVKVGGPSVEVELLPESALEGIVLLPGSASPEGVEIEAFRKQSRLMGLESGLGLVFRTSVDARGAWRIGSLAAGPWLVRLRVPGSIAGRLGWDAERVERCREVPWLFRVPEGGVARADIDLRDEVLLELDGRLRVGDRITEGYAKLLLEPPLGLQAAFAGVDEQGRFRLHVRQPGRYRLLIEAGPGHHMYRPVTDLVDLGPGGTVWREEIDESVWSTSNGVRLDKP